MITIHRNGENYGPFSEDELFLLLKEGRIVPEDYANIEGESEWKRLNVIFPVLKKLPPVVTPKTSFDQVAELYDTSVRKKAQSLAEAVAEAKRQRNSPEVQKKTLTGLGIFFVVAASILGLCALTPGNADGAGNESGVFACVLFASAFILIALCSFAMAHDESKKIRKSANKE